MTIKRKASPVAPLKLDLLEARKKLALLKQGKPIKPPKKLKRPKSISLTES